MSPSGNGWILAAVHLRFDKLFQYVPLTGRARPPDCHTVRTSSVMLPTVVRPVFQSSNCCLCAWLVTAIPNSVVMRLPPS